MPGTCTPPRAAFWTAHYSNLAKLTLCRLVMCKLKGLSLPPELYESEIREQKDSREKEVEGGNTSSMLLMKACPGNRRASPCPMYLSQCIYQNSSG